MSATTVEHNQRRPAALQPGDRFIIPDGPHAGHTAEIVEAYGGWHCVYEFRVVVLLSTTIKLGHTTNVDLAP